MGRIINSRVTIDDDLTHEFFENRTKKDLFHRYNLVNYQDNNPELALERDIYEKQKIIPFLPIHESSRIIDIGCGVGRWGDELVKYLKTGLYVGVDYSDNLIKVARSSITTNEDVGLRKYCVGSFQKLKYVLAQNSIDPIFDIIIVNGVFMYINDVDLDICMNNILDIKTDNTCIYFKESVGVEDRYTLKDIYSAELTSQYNAIYRTITEYTDIFNKYLNKNSLVSNGEIFGDSLHNRKETTSYYWIYK